MHEGWGLKWHGWTATSVTFALIALVLAGTLGWGFGVFSGRTAQAGPPVVPPNANVPDQPKLPENGPGEVAVQSDLSVFDLRFWRPMPQDRPVTEPVSPVNYANYLRVVKRRDVKRLYAHYATSGLRIDLQCVTHPFEVQRQLAAPPHLEHKLYALAVDIAQEPVGKVFLVLIQATYWNGDRSEKQGDASTYTDTNPPIPEDLSLLVLFPQSKPCTSLQLETSPDEPEKWVPYPSPAEAYRDPGGLYAYWYVREKMLGHHYRMSWTW